MTLAILATTEAKKSLLDNPRSAVPKSFSHAAPGVRRFLRPCSSAPLSLSHTTPPSLEDALDNSADSMGPWDSPRFAFSRFTTMG